MCDPRKKNVLTKCKAEIQKTYFHRAIKNDLNVIFWSFVGFNIPNVGLPQLSPKISLLCKSVCQLEIHKGWSGDTRVSLNGFKSQNFFSSKMLFPFNDPLTVINLGFSKATWQISQQTEIRSGYENTVVFFYKTIKERHLLLLSH